MGDPAGAQFYKPTEFEVYLPSIHVTEVRLDVFDYVWQDHIPQGDVWITEFVMRGNAVFMAIRNCSPGILYMVLADRSLDFTTKSLCRKLFLFNSLRDGVFLS